MPVLGNLQKDFEEAYRKTKIVDRIVSTLDLGHHINS